MIGKTLGHYRMLEKIGAGGMGEVDRAYDEQLDRYVAINVLPAGRFSDPIARARLLREARTASKLNHPHICTIHGVGEADGQGYIAMELVEGQPLSVRLAAGPLPAAARRYQRAAALRAALEAVQAGAVAPAAVWRSRRRRLAVLPLRNLSGDPEQEYFAEGTHEALLTDLASISALRVIARSSVMRYKGTDPPLSEIAGQLKADAVLTGSVMRLGDRVRITAQLVDVATEEHLWAGRYERALRDVLSLQNEIVAEIARTIELQLTPQEQARLARGRPVNPKAYEAYLKGRFHWYKLSREHFDTALEYFQLALEKDPDYALAVTGAVPDGGGAATELM